MSQPEKIALNIEKPLKTGELLVQEGLVRHEDIDMALSMQKKRLASPALKKSRLLGMILCDLNLITPFDIYHTLHKHNKLITLESALVSSHLLSKESAGAVLNEAKQKNLPFISHLIKSGLVSFSQMQKLLFGLFHIPFRSISDFIFNEKDRAQLTRVLDQRQSAEQGIIPLVAKDNTILFGITDPDNLLVIRQLNEQFPQYRFKALFIPYSGFEWFSKIIYGQAEMGKTAKEKSVDEIDLSLLLNFKTLIKDPGKEKKAVWILYERYEMLRRLIGKPQRGNFQDEFNVFIQKNHTQICREYQVGDIEYSLEKQGGNVSVIALPVSRKTKGAKE